MTDARFSTARRAQLQRALSLLAVSALEGVTSRAWATPQQSTPRLLVVFLRGAYDAANVLVPVGSDFYYEARPTIAIARPQRVLEQGAAIPLVPLQGTGEAVPANAEQSAQWGMHPAWRDSLYPFWMQGQLAVVPFAGTHDMSRSHFETQDSIEAGLAPGAGIEHRSGFLNRLAEVLAGRGQAVAFTDGLPAILAGAQSVPNVSLKGNARAPQSHYMQAVQQMYAGTRHAPLIAQGLDLRTTVAEEARAMQAKDAMHGEMQAASRKAMSAQSFETEARRMASLMRDRFNLGFIDVGGWDTHVNQGAAQGALADKLTGLGNGLSLFAQEMEGEWDNTVVVVLSEFGRTFRENGTRGTDHGHGSAYWVLGGGVRGGRFAGDQISLVPKTLNEGRDWPVLNEYRAMFAGMFRHMYGLSATQLAQVFPGAGARDLGLV